ncbi:unnamed protein product [Nesidiocoris tenuis]|uniref:UBC core domain-containing protein n=1 Tax=Nesidiocoris tenuis TaxID=355587 RepID=A0A6H5GK29_9HEMI|nr:unnamed protein product [Nesidiocoris tenuis]
MSTPARRRLMRDFKRLQEDPPTGVSGAPTDNNIMIWNAVIFGPHDTPFEDGTFKLTIEFTEEYPNKPPTVRFVSKMFHPNVYADGGICLDILQNRWSPTYDVSAILTSIQYEDLLKPVTANIYKNWSMSLTDIDHGPANLQTRVSFSSVFHFPTLPAKFSTIIVFLVQILTSILTLVSMVATVFYLTVPPMIWTILQQKLTGPSSRSRTKTPILQSKKPYTNHFDESVDPLRGSDPNSEEILENSPGTSAAGTSDEMAKFQQHRIEDSLAASVRLKNIGSFAESVWPKIVDAERRKYFSVHEYGTKVLDTFSDNSEEFKDFGEIVKDKPANEIGRYFLAVLTMVIFFQFFFIKYRSM